MQMRKLAALLIAILCCSASRAEAKVDESGGPDTITLVDTQAASNGAAHGPPGTDPAGTPSVIATGLGDRPPVPAIIYVNGVGACMSNGNSSLITEPLIQQAYTLPGCPGSTGSGGAAAPPPPTPLEAAYAAWYWQTRLPSPTLSTSPPNGAITGLDLFLAIGGPQHLVFDVPALGYVVHLEVSSVYDINWGEPRPDTSANGRAVTKGHTTQGGPYPNGDLRHQYIERGTATIEVTQRWTAQWSAGGQSGTIADRLGTSSTLTIPIQEIQAVLVP